MRNVAGIAKRSYDACCKLSVRDADCDREVDRSKLHEVPKATKIFGTHSIQLDVSRDRNFENVFRHALPSSMHLRSRHGFQHFRDFVVHSIHRQDSKVGEANLVHSGLHNGCNSCIDFLDFEAHDG